MKKFLAIALLALGVVMCLTSNAGAIPMFARMYSYDCSTCHYPGYGQLNKFGYKFRAAGYRIPSDIGKDMNDGKFDLTNYMSFRYSGGLSATTTSNANQASTPDNLSFTLGGASIFLGGGISKNFFTYSELGLGDGSGIFAGSAPALSNAKIGYVSGTEDDFFTVRIGKFAADGFGGSDRGAAGNATIASAIKPTGTGIELGYTHQDFRATLSFYNGIQNDQDTGLINPKNGNANTAAPNGTTSDSNNAKDLELTINQFIGDDGMALNYFFYNGSNSSLASNGTAYAVNKGGTGDAVGQEYFTTALFFSTPLVKNLDFKTGGELAQTGTGIFTQTGAVMGPFNGGFFGELDYTMDDLTPLVFRCDYGSSDLNSQYTDTVKFTLGALTPVVHVIYMNPQITLTMADQGSIGYNDVYKFTDSLNVFF